MNLTLTGFSLTKRNGNSIGNANNNKAMRIGFLLRRTASESASEQDLEHTLEDKACMLEKEQPGDVVVDISDEGKWARLSRAYTIPASAPGLYTLFFARCNAPHVLANFHLDLEFRNPGPNYLSAGDMPLPAVYLAFFVLFTVALGVWVWLLVSTAGAVHRIHYLMAALLALKCLSLLFEGIRFHYLANVGASELWSIIYFVFAFLKGVTLFTVILLIGSGWSLTRAALQNKERGLVFLVLVLQVLDNLAMVVLEETAPGSQGWLRWRDILHLVDILCCVAILFPIVWSIRHLRQASEADGKAHKNLGALVRFRSWYVLVVAYIYFTRIVVYVIESTIPFNLSWIGAFLVETATLVFFVVTGYSFRPAVDNPYLLVGAEEGEDNEFGLDTPDEEVATVVLEPGSVEKRPLSSSPSRDGAEGGNKNGLEMVEPRKR